LIDLGSRVYCDTEVRTEVEVGVWSSVAALDRDSLLRLPLRGQQGNGATELESVVGEEGLAGVYCMSTLEPNINSESRLYSS
jgi:hypothetical protein